MGLLMLLKGVWYLELRYYSDVSNCKDLNLYYFFCFLVKELWKNYVDFVYVNLIDYSIVMVILNLNSIFVLYLNDVN